MISVDESKLREVLDALTGVLDAKDGEPAQLWSVSGGVYEAVACMNSIRALRSMLEQTPSKTSIWDTYAPEQKEPS